MLTTDNAALRRSFALVDLLTRGRHPDLPDGVIEALLLREKPLKLKMYKEAGHGRPHFHVDYGREVHSASYAIDTGERLDGNLDRKYDRVVIAWTEKNRETLLAIWNALQEGRFESDIVRQLSALD